MKKLGLKKKSKLIASVVVCVFVLLPRNAEAQDKENKSAKKVEAPIMTIQEYRTDFESIVLSKRKDLDKCKKQKKSNKGRMTIVWELSETGQARSFTKGADTVEDEKLYHCVIKKIEKWKFKAPPYDRALDVEYEFSF